MGFLKDFPNRQNVPHKLFTVAKENPKCPISKYYEISCEECMEPCCANPQSKYNTLNRVEEKEDDE